MWEGVNCAGVDFSQVMHDYAGKYEEEADLQLGLMPLLLKKCIEPTTKLDNLVPFLELISSESNSGVCAGNIWARVPLDFLTSSGQQPSKQQVTSILLKGDVEVLNWSEVKEKYKMLNAQLLLCDPPYGLKKHFGAGVAAPDVQWDNEAWSADTIESVVRR
jgi:hypothetical protein